MHSACALYLVQKPFSGKVPVFGDKEEVKVLCRGAGELGWKAVRWDGKQKLWGTMEIGNIPKLLSSGKWHPVGIQRHWYGCLSRLAEDASLAETSARREKREDKTAVVNDNLERERIEALEERKRREAAQEQRDKLKSMVTATAHEVAQTRKLGLDDGVVDYALSQCVFGPVAGTSAHARVLLWIKFQMTEAKNRAYEDTGARWMTPEDIAPYYAAARDACVKRLNEAARRGDPDFDSGKSSFRKATTNSTTKRQRVGEVDTGGTKVYLHSNTKIQKDAIVSKNTVEHAPSFHNYRAVCNTCGGLVVAQFCECVCGSHWTPCHACQSFVALHQLCKFGHPVKYPSHSASLFTSSQEEVCSGSDSTYR
jgi:hypothetical protein